MRPIHQSSLNETLGAHPVRGDAVHSQIYLDYHATTPLDARVLDAMLPWLRDHVGNPHAHTHTAGRIAREAIEHARAQIAELIGARADEVVFTSGATEATNIALRGVLEKRRGHVVTSAIEHSCVRETLQDLARRGATITTVGVGADGVVDPEAVAAAFAERTRLVSVMMVNNETGVVQPLDEIATMCRASDVLLHSDAAQALAHLPIDTRTLAVDYLSLSAHKVYGPQGVGALYCRVAARAQLRPVLTGGGQERGLRPGTLPTALCVGFGVACAVLTAEGATERNRIAMLRDEFLDRLRESVAGVHVNGTLNPRVAGNLNLAFDGVDADMLLARLPDVALSTGSACASAALAPSHVLLAMGLPRDRVLGSIRIAFGRQTTRNEIERAAARIVEEIRVIRTLCTADGAPPRAASGRRA